MMTHVIIKISKTCNNLDILMAEMLMRFINNNSRNAIRFDISATQMLTRVMNNNLNIAII